MRRSLSLLAALAAILVDVVVTGCGGNDEATTTPAPASQSPFGGGAAPPSGSARELPPAFVRCMAAQGYDVQSSDDIHSAPMAALQQCFGALHG